MIFAVDQNCFYDFDKIDPDKYQFYKGGCLINANKVKEMSQKSSVNEPIIAKTKIKIKTQQEIAEKDL